MPCRAAGEGGAPGCKQKQEDRSKKEDVRGFLEEPGFHSCDSASRRRQRAREEQEIVPQLRADDQISDGASFHPERN